MKGKVISKTADMRQEDWLSLRTKGIGGSDSAAAIGLSRWKDPLTLWAEKTGKIKAQEAGEAAYWGNILEEPVAQRFAEVTGLSVRRHNALLAHEDEEYNFMRANIDRDIVGVNQFLEVKTASTFKGGEWEDEEIPIEYYCQGQHYLAVTGCEGLWYAVLIGGQRFHHVYAPRDDEFITELMRAEKEFWGYVERNEQPPVNASESCANALKELYPDSGKNVVELPKEADFWAKEYDKAKKAIGEHTDKKVFYQNLLIAQLAGGDAWGGLTPSGRKVTWRTGKNGAKRFNLQK